MANQEDKNNLSPVKRALLAMEQMRARLDAAEKEKHEPAAIIGMACRLPGGVETLEDYWRLLDEGVDAIRDVPEDRFDIDEYYNADKDVPGKMSVRQAGFMEGIDQFDPLAFGIAPREAEKMDPQQRLLLEVSWEALESAGLTQDSLARSRTGVYTGILGNDYAWHTLTDLNEIDGFASFGVLHSFGPNRISYHFDLTGPSLPVDTLCSSGAVAVHQALQSLRSRESDVALAGAVNLMISPHYFISYSNYGMLAPDSRCKTFDKRANGFVRGEGCGMVVMKRLSDAVRDGDNIWAIVRGSATNQDGRTNVLTAPNMHSQKACIQDAVKSANVDPSRVGYVEAHGTGTPLGDPIEIEALGAVYGAPRENGSKCYVGSVKTNIGHLESAAGIASIIKATLSLRNQSIPRNLNFQEVNPLLLLDGTPFAFPLETTPWESNNGPRLAGVSSFGAGGTNAHVILEEAPPPAESTPDAEGLKFVLPISAHTRDALKALAARYANWLKDGAGAKASLTDICWSAVFRRTHLRFRLTMVGASHGDFIEQLEAYARGEERQNMHEISRMAEERPKLVFILSGQGPRWWPISDELFENEPVFRETLEKADAEFRKHADWSLIEEMRADESKSRLGASAYTQPALFAYQIALAELWKSWGIEPDAVIGHSMGEVPAAYISGALSLEDAIRVIYHRGRLIQTVSGQGAMAAVGLSFEDAEKAIKGMEDKLSVGANNSPGNSVLSGEPEALNQVIEKLQKKEVFAKILDSVDFASHSPQMEPLRAEFDSSLAGIAARATAAVVYSTVAAGPVDGGEMGEKYWSENLRRPVMFAKTVDALIEDEHRLFVEVAPHPVLTGPVIESLKHHGVINESVILPTLNRKIPEYNNVMLGSLGAMHGAGYPVDFAKVQPEGHYIPLPTYAWQHERYWLERKEGIAFAHSGPARNPWEEAAREAKDQAELIPVDMHLEEFGEKWRVMDGLATAYMTRALKELGIFQSAGESLTVEAFHEKLGTSENHRLLLGRWCERLTAAGYLRAEGENYVASAPVPLADVSALEDEARAVLHDAPALMAFLERSGAALPGLLKGETNMMEVMFPGGSTELADELYSDWSWARYCNNIIRAALQAAAAAMPGGRKLRILEVGAGAGGTAGSVLPHLAAADVEYHYTDVSDFYTRHASERFAEYDFVEYGILDLEKDPLSQGFEKGYFDIIIAANVLHATHKLEESIKTIHTLLAGGGMLLLYEATEMFSWYNVTTGLLEPWQWFDDSVRAAIPLLREPEWQAVLTAHGFSDVISLPGADSSANVLGQHVFLARTPGEAAFSGASSSAKKGAGAADWLYDITWEAVPNANSPAGIQAGEEGAWLVFADESGVALSISEFLNDIGQRCVLVNPGEEYEVLDTDQYGIRPDNPEDMARLLADAFGDSIPRGILHLWSLNSLNGEPPGVAKTERLNRLGVISTLHLLRALAGADWSGVPPRMYLITGGVHAVPGWEGEIDPLQSGLWGLGRTIAQENSDFWGGLLDVEPSVTPEQHARELLTEILNTDGEDHVTFRRGQRFVARMTRADSGMLAAADSVSFSPDASYLITGGLGALGVSVASWMLEKGARNLILMGRTELPPREEWDGEMSDGMKRRVEAVRDLEEQGAVIFPAAVDITNAEQLRGMIDDLEKRGMPGVRGVFHAALVLRGGALTDQTAEDFHQSLAPKIAGTWQLHELFENTELDFFLLFSSAASMIGPLANGMGSYAAGNAFQDNFARWRNAKGLPAISVNWGIWSEGEGKGAATTSELDTGAVEKLARRGVGSFTVQEGLKILGALIQRSEPRVIVSPMDWSLYEQMASYKPALFSRLFAQAGAAARKAEEKEAAAGDGAETDEEMLFSAEDLGYLSPEDQHVVVSSYVQTSVAKVMRLQVERVDGMLPLKDQGLDSLMAVELRNLLESGLGITVPVNDLIGGAGVEQVTKILVRKLPTEPSSALSVDAEVPLSQIQRGLWFESKLTGGLEAGAQGPAQGMAAYNACFGVRLERELDVDLLESALKEITANHAVLRSTFMEREGEPVQRVLSEMEPDFRAGEAHWWKPEELNDFLSEEAHRPFDLENGPVWHARLFTLKEDGSSHILLLVSHRIGMDDYSLRLLSRAWLELYERRASGDTEELPERDFEAEHPAGEEAEWLSGEESEKLLKYWLNKLDGELPDLNLPIDFPRSSSQANYGANLEFHLSPELVEKLNGYRPDDPMALYAVMHTAYNILLHRYTGQQDIMVGLPVSGRVNEDVRSKLGSFANLVVIRSQFPRGITVGELYEQIRKSLTEAAANQKLPFPVLVEKLEPIRNVDRFPIFQTTFSMENAKGAVDVFALMDGEILEEGLEGEPVLIQQDVSPYELFFRAVSNGDSVSVNIQYNVSVFRDGTIERMREQYLKILEEIVGGDPALPISRMELLEDIGPRDDALRTDDQLEVTAPHLLFQEQVDKVPGMLAVIDDPDRLTYRQLDESANRLANHLLKAGLKLEDSVAIRLERSANLIVVILAVLKAGGVCVPLDADYDPTKAAYIIKDADARFIIVEHEEQIPEGTKIEAIALKRDGAAIKKESGDAPNPKIESGNLAFTHYLDLDTDEPRGMDLTHSYLADSTEWFLSGSGLYFGARTLQHTSPSSLMCLFEIFSTICAAGTLILIPDEIRGSDDEFVRYLTYRKVQRLFADEYLLNNIAEISDEQEIVPHFLNELFVNGAQLYMNRDIKLLMEKLKGCKFRYIFAIPQSGIASSMTLSWNYREDSGQLPIGNAIDGRGLNILDSEMQPVPVGVLGELYVASDNPPRGYRNRPDLTADVFLPNSFADAPNSRLIRTGYAARYGPGGAIRPLGRIERRMTIRGFRVNLEEIERSLQEHSAIRRAIAVKRDDIPGNGIIAYIASDQIVDRMTMLIRCEVELESGQSIPLVSDNISPSGISLVGVPEQLEKGTPVKVKLVLPSVTSEVSLEGTVMWRRGSTAGIQFKPSPINQSVLKMSLAHIIEMEALSVSEQAMEFRAPVKRACIVDPLDGDSTALISEGISLKDITLIGAPERWKPGKRVRIRLTLPGTTEEMRFRATFDWREGRKAGFVFDLDESEKEVLARFFEHFTENQLLSTAHLRSFLMGRLPYYMVPYRFVILDSIPTLPDGSVATNLLPYSRESIAGLEAVSVQARTPVEGLVSGIWADVLEGILDGKDPGIFDNFFDIGGNSLMVLRVLDKIMEEFQVQIPLRKFIASPTIADLASRIVQLKTEQEESEAIDRAYEELADLSAEDLQAILDGQKAILEQ